MPGNWMHYYFAKDVAKDHNFTFRRDKSYFFGALGPDFLTYLPEQKVDQVDYFTLFHEEKTPDVLERVFLSLDKEELSPFLHGFLAHYALDSETNFFIHSLQNEGYDRQSVKDALEEAVVRRRKITSAQKVSFLSQVNLGKNLPQEIADFYESLAREVFELNLTSDEMKRAYSNFRTVLLSNEASFSLLRLRSRWYQRKPQHLFSWEETESLYQEFQQSYERSRILYGRLLRDKKSCGRNFLGIYL